MSRGGVAQWVARLTRDRWIPVSRDFEPHQRCLFLLLVLGQVVLGHDHLVYQ